MDILSGFNDKMLDILRSSKNCQDLYQELIINRLVDCREGSINYIFKQLFKMEKVHKEQFVKIFRPLIEEYDKSCDTDVLLVYVVAQLYNQCMIAYQMSESKYIDNYYIAWEKMQFHIDIDLLRITRYFDNYREATGKRVTLEDLLYMITIMATKSHEFEDFSVLVTHLHNNTLSKI